MNIIHDDSLADRKNLSRLRIAIATLLTVVIVQTVLLASEKGALKSNKKGRNDVRIEERQRGNEKTKEAYVKALDEALKAAGKYHDLASHKFKITVRPSEEGWSAWLVFLPETPGADLMINVKREGETTVVSGY